MIRRLALAVALACVATRTLHAQRAPHDAPARPAADADTAARAIPADRWLGSDKVKHAFLGGLTYAVGYAGARGVGAGRRTGLALAVVPTALVSIGKEVRDRRSYGHFSARDLVADALGAAAYAALLAHTSR